MIGRSQFSQRADWAAWLDLSISSRAILKLLPSGTLTVQQVG